MYWADNEIGLPYLLGRLEEMNDNFKSYSNLTVANGKITLNPLTKKRLHALVEWVTQLYRVGQDPYAQPFPVVDANMIIEKGKEIKKYKEFCYHVH